MSTTPTPPPAPATASAPAGKKQKVVAHLTATTESAYVNTVSRAVLALIVSVITIYLNSHS